MANNNLSILMSILLLCALLSIVHAANILAIIPTASYSHQMPLLSLTKALAQKGHNLTVITTNPLNKPTPNYTEIDLSFTYDYWKVDKTKKDNLINLQGKMNAVESLNMFVKGSNAITGLQLGSPVIQKFIKYLDNEKPKFDLVLYEDLIHPAFIGFLHKVGQPPFIAMITVPMLCSTDLSEGNLCHPSYIGDMMLGTTNTMSFWERVQNYLFHFYFKLIMRPKLYGAHEAIAKKYFGPNCPPLEELLRKRALLLSSSSWLFEFARPVFPNTIHVGPLHIEGVERRPLSQDLKVWVEGAKKGFIYFSFGSNMKSSSLEDGKRSAILAALARFPEYRVIWKWEDDELENLPSNVICRKWLPQHELLDHPNIKLFITQGGLQSLQEAVHYAVPVLGIPFFGDQHYNVRVIPRLGIGRFMDFEDIDTDTLAGNIKGVLDDKSYTDNVRRVSTLSRTRMRSPQQTAVWWVEYVLQAKGNVQHLRPEYYHLNWFQYFGLDVLGLQLTPVVLLVFGMYRLIVRCRRRSAKTKDAMVGSSYSSYYNDVGFPPKDHDNQQLPQMKAGNNY